MGGGSSLPTCQIRYCGTHNQYFGRCTNQRNGDCRFSWTPLKCPGCQKQIEERRQEEIEERKRKEAEERRRKKAEERRRKEVEERRQECMKEMRLYLISLFKFTQKVIYLKELSNANNALKFYD